MKRRSFVALLAGTPLIGSTPGVFASTPEADSAGPFDVRSTALLIMDYQNAWIATLADSDPLLSRAAETIAKARAHGMDVVYCRVGFQQADYDAVPSGNMIFSQLASTAGALDDDSPAMAIDSRIAPEPGDKVVTKTRVGAFERTDLDGWLRGRGIDTLILAGISTSGVVLSTVCDAADRDYRLFVLSDACADVNPVIQDVLIQNIFPQRANVITVAELPSLLGG